MDKETQKELLKIVSKNYEEICDGFSETRNRPLWPEIVKNLEKIEDGSSVLDVGCGNGRLFEAISDKQIKYLGIDNSESLVKIAQEKYKKAEFRVANILDLGVVPEYDFDYVTSVAVLHHIPGADLRVQALRQLKNKIKSDGKIILTVWNLWSRKKFRKMIFKFFFLKLFGKNNMEFGDVLFEWRKSGEGCLSKRYYHAFTKRGLKKVIRKAGLKIVKYTKDQNNFYLILKKKK